MSLTPNFSSSESLSSPSLVTFVDSSLGSDSTITNRQITIELADGTNLVPSGTTTSYINWSYNDASIEISLLSRSMAATVTVVWLNGSTAVYTKTILMEWNLYDYVFLFGLLQEQTAMPTIISDQNYYDNALQMIVNLFNSETAVSSMDDVYSAQSSLDKNFQLMQNEAAYF